MSFNFVQKTFTVGGSSQDTGTLTFYKKGFNLGMGFQGGQTPTWQDVILSGNTALTLVNSKADGLNYVKLYGATENVPETYLDTVTLSGGCTQSSTPTPANPVPIVCNNGEIKYSKNLLKPTTATATSYFIPQADGSVVCQGTPTEYVSLLYYTYVLSSEPLSGKYTFGFFGNSTNVSYRVAILDSNSTTLITLTVADVNSTRTLDLSEYPTAFYIRIILMRTSNNAEMSGTLYPYFVKGETGLTEWRSYEEVYTDGTKEVVTDNADNTATATDLLAIGDVKDTQEVLSGSVTRKFKVLVLDGTENWIGQFNQYRVYLNVSDIENKTGRNADIMCTHYEPTSASGTNYETCFHYTNQLFITPQTTITSTTEWTAYLQEQYANGTPVVMIYPLSSAKTETVSAQVLTKSPVTQTAGSINNLPVAYTESSHTTPKPTMPLDIVCNNGVLKVKNLYDGTTATMSGNKYSYTQTATGFTATAQASTGTSSRVNLFCPVSWFTLGETYTISGFGDYSTAVGKATPSDSTGAAAYKSKNTNKTFTVSSIDEGQKYVSIGIYFGAQTEGTTFSCQQIQLEQGDTVTSYLPYGQTYADGTTETVEVDTTGDTAMAEMLLSVGDYKDLQSVIDGAVTRNVGIKVFDGTENISLESSGFIYISAGVLPNMATVNAYAGYCTHAPMSSSTTTYGVRLGNNNTAVYWYQFSATTGLTTTAEVKAWMAEQYANGTPIIMIYPLASATTESVTPQPLTIQEGTNIITAEGSIDNLELEVSYKATA